jgi:hypothetical protein
MAPPAAETYRRTAGLDGVRRGDVVKRKGEGGALCVTVQWRKEQHHIRLGKIEGKL